MLLFALSAVSLGYTGTGPAQNQRVKGQFNRYSSAIIHYLQERTFNDATEQILIQYRGDISSQFRVLYPDLWSKDRDLTYGFRN